MLQLLLLLLPIAAISGWITGYRHRKSTEVEIDGSFIPSDYFLGLNYLINEQPDKAVDVFIKDKSAVFYAFNKRFFSF